MSIRRTNKRLRSAVVILFLSFLIILGRMFYIQVVMGAEYRSLAERQQVRDVEIAAPRGIIYDRNGEELAVSERMATLVANPALVKEPAAVAARLAPILGLDEAGLREKLEGDGRFTFLARKIEPSVAERVMAQGIRGIGMTAESKRVYPKGALAPQLIGYVGMDNVGLAGLEKQYEEVLGGMPGSRSIVGDPFGRSLDVLADHEGEQGRSIVSTIDEDIQYAAEQTLTQVVKEYGAKKAMALVMDPASGEVLAMANAPLFDANAFNQVRDEQLKRNSVVVDQYEPGSTFKIVTFAAVLEAGLVTPATRLELPPEIKVHDRVVHESSRDQPPIRDYTVTQILEQSSNVGTVMLAQKVGEKALVDMIERFGFGRKTGIDFPGEASGIVLPLKKWSGSTIGNVPMGQGISVTPLQLATAYAIIANDGVAVRPRLVRGGGPPEAARRVIGADTAAQIRRMLMGVVREGTGRTARIEGYDVAGKTGTAQKVDPRTGTYSRSLYLSSFVGMVPADSPRLVVLVMVDEPTTAYYGSSVAAPAFAKIADFALKRLEIPPARTTPVPSSVVGPAGAD